MPSTSDNFNLIVHYKPFIIIWDSHGCLPQMNYLILIMGIMLTIWPWIKLQDSHRCIEAKCILVPIFGACQCWVELFFSLQLSFGFPTPPFPLASFTASQLSLFLQFLFVPRVLRAICCSPAANLRARVEGGWGGGGGEGGRAGGRGGEVQHPCHEGCLLPSDQKTLETVTIFSMGIPWRYPGNTADDKGSPAVSINSLAVLRSVSVVCLDLHCG